MKPRTSNVLPTGSRVALSLDKEGRYCIPDLFISEDPRDVVNAPRVMEGRSLLLSSHLSLPLNPSSYHIRRGSC